ncbi:Tfp pilus assembly protein FimT/FimU [Phycisphaerales bacterium AB-hyl4]|uniref:Tfp pilus assembly protein FimT/FimU n=1 Tax=Natronomicrosphaera hydrolytica TaxID=3242702 RepID=A0ABV4U7S5_9BACT
MTDTRPHTRLRTVGPGYTMIELIMVVTTVAIVAALAVPMLGGTANSRLAAAARVLAADIDHARVASITRADQPTVVVFIDEGKGYQLAYAHDTDEPIGHPIDHRPYKVRFGVGQAKHLVGVTVDSSAIESSTIDGEPVLRFGRFGQIQQADDTPLPITLSVDNRSVTLTVDPTSGEVAVGTVQVH